MGCIASRSAGTDGVIESREQRTINRTISFMNLDNRSGRSNNTSDTAHAVVTSQPATTLNGSNRTNQAQFRFEFDPFPGRIIQPHQIVATTGAASENRPRNTRLTILNMPSRTMSRRRSADNHDSSEAAVLEQLQLDLVTIERIFQSLLGQPYHAGTAAGVLTNGDSCPPAAPDVIESLPSIRITAEDLEDENNRSCCICFGEHDLDDEVTRLPCGHLFHRACVGEWLQKNCTCPCCRWELETENVHFESGRLERMRSRRLRLKLHELERMSLKELKDLVATRLVAEDEGEGVDEGEGEGEISTTSIEDASRSELIERIKGSAKVDIIVPLPKVPAKIEACAKTAGHNLDNLRSMDIEGLRKILLESGISCNYNEIDDDDNTGEKERMVQLLVKNGDVAKSINSSLVENDDKCQNADKEEEKEEICAQEISQID